MKISIVKFFIMTKRRNLLSIDINCIYSLLILISFFVMNSEEVVNDRPIIGILAQEISHHMNSVYPDLYDSYIAASYVKYLESAGARVVPLWIGQNESYYGKMLNKINGVLLPGGNAHFTSKNGYAESGCKIIKIAEKINKNGVDFPIWATCLGFELLSYFSANRTDFRRECSARNVAMVLKFKPDFMLSRLFKNASDDVIQILQTENVTANFHIKCITEEDFVKFNLSNDYHVTSLSDDLHGSSFISIIEHHKWPFYGTQFHPEKNMFEWAVRLTGISHTHEAIKVSQYFSNFFVNEARKNFHRFSSEEEEAKSLIYNYPVTYTGLYKSSFEQCYLFEKKKMKDT